MTEPLVAFDDTDSPKGDRRKQILETALALMSQKGSSRTTMREIARGAGIQPGAIYHYFRSKEDLLLSLIVEQQYGARLDRLPPPELGRPPGDRLEALVRQLWDGAVTEEPIWRLVLGEAILGEPPGIRATGELLNLLRSGTEAWLTRDIPELDDPAAVATLLTGQLILGLIRRIVEPDGDPQHILESFVHSVTGLADPPCPGTS